MKRKIKKIITLLVTFLMMTLLTLPAQASNIEIGSITIHKYALDSLPTDPGTGLETDQANLPADAVPLEGIEFTIWRILPDKGVYPTDPNLVNTEVPNSTVIDLTFEFISDVTNGDGEIVFENLPDGVYLIKETNSQAVDGYIYTPAAPFFVSIPMTKPDGSGIFRDVHVYPKNQLSIPSKTTTEGNPNAVKPGDIISWIIHTPIPFTMNTVEEFAITDQVNADLLLIDLDTVKVYSAPNKSEGAGTEIVNGSEIYYTKSLVNGLLTVDFTDDGIAYLLTQQKGGDAFVRVEFDSEITDEAAGMSVENGAELRFTDEQGSHIKEIPDPYKPYVFSGIIGITKLEKDPDGGTDIKLDGAKFKVALSEQDALDGNFVKAANGIDDLIAETGVTHGAAGSGYAEIRGIPFGEDDVVPSTQTTQNIEFWLVEVKAPNGYNLITDPIRVTYSYVKKTDTNNVDFHYINQNVGVYNTKGFQLPQTGGAGIIISSVVGIALLGAVIFIAGRRKKTEK